MLVGTLKATRVRHEHALTSHTHEQSRAALMARGHFSEESFLIL